MMRAKNFMNGTIGMILLALFSIGSMLSTSSVVAADMAVVACPEGGVVQFVDLSNNTVIDQVPVGLFPVNLVVDPEGVYAYVVGALSFDVTVLNIRTREIEDQIPVGFVPTGIAMTPDGKKLLVANSIKGAPHENDPRVPVKKDIAIIDVSTRKVWREIETPGTPAYVAITPDGKTAIVTEPLGGIPIWGVGRIALANGVLTFVDIETQSVLHRIDLGFLPLSIAIHPNGNYCYVTNTVGNLDLSSLTAEGTIGVIDLTATPPVVVANVTTGVLSGPAGIIVTPDGKKLLVSLSALAKVAEYDLTDPSNPALKGVVDVDLAPMGMALTTDGTKTIVCNSVKDSYSILSNLASPPTVVATIDDIGDVGPLVPFIVPKLVSTFIEYVPAETLPIDYKTLPAYASVDLHYNITTDISTVTDAYLELSFYDLDDRFEAKVYVNDRRIWLPKSLVATDAWRTVLIPINDVSILNAGENVVTVEDAQGWRNRFILGSAKVILAVPMVNAQHNYKAQGARTDQENLPVDFQLFNNFPNPFNPCTEIQFQLPENDHVVLTIINMAGQKVRTLIDAEMAAGQHSVQWKGEDDSGNKVASGTYLYTLEYEDQLVSKRMQLMK